MKKFVRGGSLLAVLSFSVALIYAEADTTEALSSANDSQEIFEKERTETDLTAEVSTQTTGGDDDKKKAAKGTKVVKTVSSRPTSAGTYTATAYCLKGRTAMGHGVRRGIIAADPRVLKLGSKVSLNGGGYTGQYLVSDTGGKIKGRKIDIWVASCAEARKFGRRTVSISPI
jgi:3D (Asp-Asp-Asp) domain-containing protein